MGSFGGPEPIYLVEMPNFFKKYPPIRTNAFLGEERKMNNDRPFPLYYSGLNALAVTQALFSGRFGKVS